MGEQYHRFEETKDTELNVRSDPGFVLGPKKQQAEELKSILLIQLMKCEYRDEKIVLSQS